MHLAITNHTGARNRGAEALVRCMANGFQNYLSQAHEPQTPGLQESGYPKRAQAPASSISLYSSDPLYDRWRFQDLLTPFWGYPLLTPNHFSRPWVNQVAYASTRLVERALPRQLRGVPTRVQQDLRQASVVVAAGGDIFTSDYYNLRKHLAYPLMAKRQPVYLCSHSIGPFTPADTRYFCNAAEHIDLITVRERDSYDYLKALGIQTRVELTADVAFTLPTLPIEQTREWLLRRYGLTMDRPHVGVSISQGIIKYSGLKATEYYQCFADMCDALIDAGKGVLMIPHVMERHPDNNDVIACDEVMARMRAPHGVTMLSGEPSAVDFKSAIGICSALVGTRTHATIAAMSQGIPTVSIAYSRKAYGIMKSVYGEAHGEELTLPATDISANSLLDALDKAMQIPLDQAHIDSIKRLAMRNFTLLGDLLHGDMPCG